MPDRKRRGLVDLQNRDSATGRWLPVKKPSAGKRAAVKKPSAVKPSTVGEDEEHSPPLPPPVSDDWEVTALSGEHHFFTTVMTRSHVQKRFELLIPPRLHRQLPEACVPVTLLCRR
jgi:hypothetical protein